MSVGEASLAAFKRKITQIPLSESHESTAPLRRSFFWGGGAERTDEAVEGGQEEEEARGPEEPIKTSRRLGHISERWEILLAGEEEKRKEKQTAASNKYRTGRT